MYTVTFYPASKCIYICNYYNKNKTHNKIQYNIQNFSTMFVVLKNLWRILSEYIKFLRNIFPIKKLFYFPNQNARKTDVSRSATQQNGFLARERKYFKIYFKYLLAFLAINDYRLLMNENQVKTTSKTLIDL